jgi:sugar phosphate isomerase/epimerase
MKYLSRRDFLRTSAILGATAFAGCTYKNPLSASPGTNDSITEEPAFDSERPALNSQCPALYPFNGPVGFQAYGLRVPLPVDFYNTLKKVADFGFAHVEMCSPRGYGGDLGFSPLEQYSAQELHQSIVDAGLYCRSCHFGRFEMGAGEVNQTVDWANEMGIYDIIISAGISEEHDSLDTWKGVADDINECGRRAKEAGFQLGYHNNSIGPVIDGKLHYDLLTEMLDPDLVKLEYQVADLNLCSPAEHILQYKGRLTSLHMLDWNNGVSPLGSGEFDWPGILAAACEVGLSEHGLIVEMDVGMGDPYAPLEQSYNYLKSLELPCSFSNDVGILSHY